MTAGLCLWSSDGEGAYFADNVDSSLLVHSFHRGLSNPAGSPLWNSCGIWKVRYGARACARGHVCCFSGGPFVERKLYTHRVRETSVCLERWACLPLCVCLCGHERERERERERVCCVSPWEIMPGHSIHQKTLISPFDKKGIESLFRSQPPTEETAGGCYTQVSQHRFRSLSARTNTQFAIISCHLQSDIYSIPH